jgi:kynureninase
MKQYHQFKNSLDYARSMDENDPLQPFRKHFVIREEDVIYLDGNSLGRLPVKSHEKLQRSLEHEWGTRLIRSWNEGWYSLAEETAKSLAGIIGCGGDEVIMADSTTLNLYKLAFAALRLNSGRKKIVSDVFNFPTDLYAIQGIIQQLDAGHQLHLIPSRDDIHITPQDIEDTVDEGTALVVLSLVSYKSAFLYDMEAVTEAVHEKGALIIWDLSHAAGAVPVDLKQANADMAVGCTYKYLNGGPGSPAYLYVRKDLQEKLTSPIWGWFGEEDPFAFNLQYRPAKGIRKFVIGPPPVLSLSSVEPAIQSTLEAGMDRIREKSIHQSEYLLHLVRESLLPLGYAIGSPGDPQKRGSHISLRHPEAFRICQAMISPENHHYKVIPDFREPDNIRLGINPLYNTYKEIHLAVDMMKEIVTDNLFQKHSRQKSGVT